MISLDPAFFFFQPPTFRLPEVKQLLAAKDMLTTQCVRIAPRLKLIRTALIDRLAMVGLLDSTDVYDVGNKACFAFWFILNELWNRH